MEETKIAEGTSVIIPDTKAEIVATVQDGAVVEYDFEKVNLDDTSSILGYCGDVTSEISDILKSTAELSVSQEQKFISDDILKTIVSFDESLDESEKEAKKEEGLAKRFINSLKKLTGNKEVEKEEEMKTYRGRYKDYTEKIDTVIANVELVKQSAWNDIDLKKDIVKQMRPLVEKLEVMINSGHEERNKYDLETTEMAKVAQTIDDQHKVQYRSQVSDIFNKSLDELERVLIIYKEQMQEYSLQTNTDMITVMSANSFITHEAPILQAQGSTQILNRMETMRLEQMSILKDATNIAIQNNAKNLESNIRTATDLMVNGGISMETLQTVQKTLQSGVTLIKKGKQELQTKIEKDRVAINKINEILDQNSRELVDMIEQTAGAMQTIAENNSTTSSPKPYRRSLTTRKRK